MFVQPRRPSLVHRLHMANAENLHKCRMSVGKSYILEFVLNIVLTLNLPTTTIVAQPFNVIKWQLKFNLVA